MPVLRADLVSDGVATVKSLPTPVASGDAVPKSYADGLAGIVTLTQASHGFAVGDLVKLTGTTYGKAQADSAANAEVVGMVKTIPTANTFTVTTVGYMTGLTGLTAGGVYFLSPSSAGAMTLTEPTTVGQIRKPVFIADTTTSGYVVPFPGQVITASTTTLDTDGTLAANSDGVIATQKAVKTYVDAAAPFGVRLYERHTLI